MRRRTVLGWTARQSKNKTEKHTEFTDKHTEFTGLLHHTILSEIAMPKQVKSIHQHTHTHTNTQLRTHIQTHTHMHAYTHTNTHTYLHPLTRNKNRHACTSREKKTSPSSLPRCHQCKLHQWPTHHMHCLVCRTATSGNERQGRAGQQSVLLKQALDCDSCCSSTKREFAT